LLRYISLLSTGKVLTDASLQMYSHLRGSTCKETPVSLDLQGELKVVGKSVSAVE